MSPENHEGTEEVATVSVSSKGQATIPQELRERHGIEAPGKVHWFENEDGQLVVEPIRSITDFRGAGSSEKSARELLEESRESDRDRDERLADRLDDTNT